MKTFKKYTGTTPSELKLEKSKKGKIQIAKNKEEAAEGFLGEAVLNEKQDIRDKVTVIDTKSLSTGSGLLVLSAIKGIS